MCGLTNSAGTVTDSYSYDAFGNPLSSQGSTVKPYRYTGQQLELSLQIDRLLYNVNRAVWL